MPNTAPYRKLAVALISAGAVAVSVGLFDADLFAVVAAFAGALGVYAAPNTPNDDAGRADLVTVLVVATFLLVLLLAFGVLPD